MSNPRLKHGDAFKPKLIALSVAACFGLSATQASANPTGGTVSSGSASFSASGNTLTITNTAGAIINWQSFSIGVNEVTRFLQSSSSSSVLNRVIGRNGVVPQSVIDGVLSSNGRVFLLNSSGILFGAGARIDVAGLVASSLNLSDADFLAGRMRFTETPGAGKVSNAGTIDTASGGPGGRVFLIAPDVENSGIIRTPQGQIVLAAGKSVDLVSENSPFVTVTITADSERALNLGKLVADSGRIGMFGALVRQGGVAQANTAVAGANGEIRLVATKDLTLDEGSTTTANGPSGGNILLQAQGGTNLVSGTVEAQGNSGQGGTVQALGVRVGVLGHGVIDASGETGGGTVLVGGDAHGANPNVQNAQQTLVGPDGIIRADARTTGDGGRVIVWSDQYTRFYGSISARGGSQSGNGGFVETSAATLDATGGVSTSAANGRGGQWLLDPDFIEIVAATNSPAALGCATITPAICFNDAPQPGISQVTLATIDAAMRPANGSVTLQAHQDITLLTDLTLPAVGGGRTFTAQAGNNINLHGVGASGADTGFNIVANGNNVTLIANDAASGTASGKGSITSLLGTGSDITTNAGNVSLFGAGVTVGNINTSTSTGLLGAGNVVIGTALQPVTNSIVVTGSITTASNNLGYGGGSVDLVTQSGNITVNGTINTRGANGYGLANFNGSSGGSVTLLRTDMSTPGAVSVSGSIVTSGGDGVVDQTTGLGGSGGIAGNVTIGGAVTTLAAPCIDCSTTTSFATPLNGDIFVGGSIIARGGNGSVANPNPTLLTPNSGGIGVSGGTIQALASGKVTVGSVDGGVVDASGGLGGAGSTAVHIVLSTTTIDIPGGSGGPGGGGGLVSLEGGTVAVSGNVLAYGGAGGNGGDGIPLTPSGGAGGLGGLGGDILLFGTTSVSVSSANATGGAGGNGGAYGGAGGFGGDGGSVVFTVPTGTIAPTVDVGGGAGGAGGAGNGGLGGIGGDGGSGGGALVVADTIDLSKSGVIGANGGAGGAGGAGATIGANGGNGGNGGAIDLIYGSTFVASTASLNPSVSGGAGGTGGAGATAGLTGGSGVDGTIVIQMASLDSTLAQVDLATNTVIDGTNRWIKTENVPSIDEIEKKDKASKQKKEVACK